MINYESPLFVDIVLYTIYMLMAVAVLLTVWSVVRGRRMQDIAEAAPHRVPARRIALITIGVLVLTMLVTWLTASTDALTINGRTYSDTLWLRISDMLINTTLVLVALILLAGVFAAVSAMRNKG